MATKRSRDYEAGEVEVSPVSERAQEKQAIVSEMERVEAEIAEARCRLGSAYWQNCSIRAEIARIEQVNEENRAFLEQAIELRDRIWEAQNEITGLTDGLELARKHVHSLKQELDGQIRYNHTLQQEIADALDCGSQLKKDLQDADSALDKIKYELKKTLGDLKTATDSLNANSIQLDTIARQNADLQTAIIIESAHVEARKRVIAVLKPDLLQGANPPAAAPAPAPSSAYGWNPPASPPPPAYTPAPPSPPVYVAAPPQVVGTPAPAAPPTVQPPVDVEPPPVTTPAPTSASMAPPVATAAPGAGKPPVSGGPVATLPPFAATPSPDPTGQLTWPEAPGSLQFIGTVTTESGPAASAHFSILDAAGKVIARSITSKDGKFAVASNAARGFLILDREPKKVYPVRAEAPPVAAKAAAATA